MKKKNAGVCVIQSYSLANACAAYIVYLMGHLGPWDLDQQLHRAGFTSWRGHSDRSLSLKAKNGDEHRLSLKFICEMTETKMSQVTKPS